MKIESIRIKNFRGYQDSGDIKIDDFTAFIGKNDAGKSTILDALNIFFGNHNAKIDKDDVNIHCRKGGNVETSISVRFSHLPEKVDLDAGFTTTLKDEYLVIADDRLEIVQTWTDAGKMKVFIKANHPRNAECCDLLKKKITDLKKIVEKLKLDCAKDKNAVMRRAIWDHYKDDLQLGEVSLEAESKDGDIKSIWEKIQAYLPLYSLFKADRSNEDKDDEVQDPLKNAVREFVGKDANIKQQLDDIAKEVKGKLETVAQRTLQKIQETSPEIANTLHPKLTVGKWEDFFTKGISITGDEDIPIAKRGSGIRRLILMNFFRAEVERKKGEKNAPDVIYAIEEPETSQHADFQKKLIEALKQVAALPSAQVMITTHSSAVVKALAFPNIRMIATTDAGTVTKEVEGCVLPHPSLNEASYLAFEKEASEEYHNELYGYLQAEAGAENDKNWKEKGFESWLVGKGLAQGKKWIRIGTDGKPMPPLPCTLQTFVRNTIHHPENRANSKYTDVEIAQSIEEMRKLIAQIRTPVQNASAK